MNGKRALATRCLTVKPLAAAVAALIGAEPALAQQPTQVDIEELIVTASRRESTVQDLPLNIAALSGDALEQQRLTDLTEFGRWVPGLAVVSQGPRASSLMTVRGLNVLSLTPGEFLTNTSGDTVSTYLGEIPLYVDFKMKDLQRVEVLIGPQGTLYGAGTLGGAVRYIPNAPDTNDFTFDLHGDLYGLSHASDLGYAADAAINVPLVEDRLAFRASVAYLDDPGFIDYPFLVREAGVSNPEPDFNNPADVAANLRGQNDVDFEQTTSARLALLWEASDTVQATFNYYFQNQDVGGRTINSRHTFGTGNYESALRFVEPNERENSLFSVEVIADLGFAQLTSATGFSEFDETGQRDQTDLLLSFGSGYEDFPSFAAFTRDINHEERVNQELRLVSNGTGPWGWIAGVFYNAFEQHSTSEEFAPNYPAFAFPGDTFPRGDLEYYQLTTDEFTETAVFGEVSYQFTDRLSLVVGGRQFNFEDDAFINFDIPFFDLSTARGNVADDDGFLGKINLSYQFSPDLLGYVTLSEGYRAGGVNPIAPCLSPLPPGQNICALPDEILFQPDETRNFEIGVHSTLRDGALLVNASIYNIDWDDIQTQDVTENGSIPITVNGNGARSQGLELSIQTRGGEHWSFTGSYAYNDAQLSEDAVGLVDGADAFDGDRLSGTPQHQGSFHANYFRMLDNGWDLDVGYGFTFSSDVLTKVGLRSDGETLGGYTVHGASVGISKERWSASLYADNITDKFAETSVRNDQTWIFTAGNFTMRRYFRDVLRPRTVGIEFRYRLGE